MKHLPPPDRDPETDRYSFFSHRDCAFFPCHNTDRPEDFNCLFCYCPLYALGERCGGAFTYTADGVKDCSDCLLPHRRDSYERIAARFPEIAALAGKRRPGKD